MAGDDSVHVTLTVDDQLTPMLAQITKAVGGVSKALKDLGASKIVDTMSAAADKLNKSFAALTGKTGDFAAIVSQMQELTKALHEIADAHAKLGAAQNGAGDHGNAKPPKWHEKWAEAGTAMTGAGTAIGAVGTPIDAGLKKVYEAGVSYQAAFASFKGLNLGDTVNADADKFASAAQLYGVSATQMMNTLGGLSHTIGYDQAKALTPFVAQMEFANQAVYSGGQKFDEGQAASLGKIMQMRGFKSPDEMKAQADLMEHIISGTTGQVMPSQILEVMQQGGVAATQKGNDKLIYELAPLIGAYGGNAGDVGAGLNSAYQSLALGRSSAEATKELEHLNLVQKDAHGRWMVDHDAHGHFQGIKAGGLKGSELITQDPLAYLRDVLLPAFKAKGINSDEAIRKEIGTVLSDPKAATFFTKLYDQRAAIDRQVTTEQGALGIGGVQDLARKTPEGAMRALAASWENFLKALSPSLMEAVAKGLNLLASGLDWLTRCVQAHPELVKGIMAVVTGFAIFIGVLGTILTVVGTIMLAIAAVGALFTALGTGVAAAIVAVVAVIAAGITAFLFLDWSSIGDWISKQAASVKSWVSAAWTSTSDWVSKTAASAQAKAGELWAATKDWASRTAAYAQAKAVALWTSVWDWISSTAATIRAKASAAASTAGAALSNAIGWLWTKMRQLPEAIGRMASDATHAVAAFGQKVWEGFKAGISQLADKVVDFFKTAMASVSNLLGLGSGPPSNSSAPGQSGTQSSASFWSLPPGMGLGMNLGASLYDWLSGSGSTIQGSPAPAQAISPGAAATPAGGQASASTLQTGELRIQPGQVVISLDGRTIATAVMEFMARQVGGPNTGPTDFNTAGRFTPAGVHTGAMA